MSPRSPTLPWEVIERVIGCSPGHPETLRNFSLSCRDLRPRSLCFMVEEVNIRERSQAFDFCDFLQTKPHLKPLVRAIIVDLHNFAPFPLLHVLPNLSELTLSSPPYDYSKRRVRGHANADARSPGRTDLNRSVLTSCRYFGTHIQTLHLTNLPFSTSLEFSRILLAFTNLANLICEDVTINAEGNRAHLEVLKRRLSERLRLKALTIESDTRPGSDRPPQEVYHDSASVSSLLLDPGLAQPTIESVTVRLAALGTPKISRLSGWPQLQSLTLIVGLNYVEDITDTTVLLKDFRHPTLKDIVVELHGRCDFSFRSADSGLHAELEKALLRFPRPQMTWAIENLRAGRRAFWTREFGKFFPALHGRGALKMALSERRRRTNFDDSALLMGHEMTVNALVASPDGQWIASGSSDGTIIIWDTSNGQIARQWVPHRYTEVESLAFSPDSRHLVSISRRLLDIVIWDLNGVSCAVLEGHTELVISCVWSPKGDVIASGSYDCTVRLWNAHTFHQLHILETPHLAAQLVKFSPDGRWLLSMYGQGNDHHVWDVVSGTLHKVLKRLDDEEPDPFSELIAGSFDPGTTRITTVKFDATRSPPIVWDVETGSELLVLGDGGPLTTNIAFSPSDGRLVVTASRRGTMKIWDAYTGAELCSLEGHRDIVSRVLFSPCGTYIASASDDRTVRLWRTGDGTLLVTFSEHRVEVRHVAFSGDGKTLWSGALDGTVATRRISDIVLPDVRNAT